MMHHFRMSWENSFLGCFHVVVQAVKICLGKQMMWVWLKETVHFMDLLEWFSAKRDVHPAKTAWICLRKQLQESAGHADCVWTLALVLRCGPTSHLQVCKWNWISLYLLVSFFRFPLFPPSSRGLIPNLPLKLVFRQTASLTFIQIRIFGVTVDIYYLFEAFFCFFSYWVSVHISMQSWHSAISDKLWGLVIK